jgi:spore coat polysaccharide biosynthesis predicted glycosyltransferase SpsG
MAKILFVPTESREIVQFSLVKTELEAMKHEIMAIALDAGKALDKGQEALEILLKEKGFSYRPITDYRTRNMLNIIKAEKPDIIVTDWSGFTPNALIYAANYAGIPCLQINDGITANYFAARNIPSPGQSWLKLMKRAFRLLMFRANPRPLGYLFTTLISIYSPLQFTRKMAVEMLKSTYPVSSYTEGLNIAVVSPFARDAHIKMGAPAEKLFVTGQPRFDLIDQSKSSSQAIMAQLKVPQNKGIIVLATQPLSALWTEEERKEFLEAILNVMAEFPEKQLVIKLHPSDKMEEYQQMSAVKNSNVIICQHIDLYGLLRSCDVLITAHSTVALEAMILNKPVITVNLTGRPDVMPYAESGAALGVYLKEDLAPAIDTTLYNDHVREDLAKKREEFVFEHAYKLDGQATGRVVELMMRLIKEAKNGKKGEVAV